jgi:flagellar biosynthesis/type III secretory pathway chaperone
VSRRKGIIAKVFGYLADKLSGRKNFQMEQLLKKLIGLLEHTMELYQSLLAVVQNEKNAVVGLDLQQLNEACKAKDNLLLKLRILEEQREQIMVRLAAEIGCSTRGLTLSQLSLRVDESYACRLIDLSRDLLALIQSLQDATQQNKFLMSHSMQLIQGSYNLLNNLMAANPLYHRSGNVQNTDQTGKLLSGAI